MLLAEDFRALAWDALRGRWKQAAGVGLLAGLMGAALSGSGVNIRFDKDDLSLANYFFESNFWSRYMGVFIGGAVILAVYWVARLMIGGAVTLGYAQYNLNLVDHKETRVDDLFSHFNRLGAGFCMQFLRWLYVFLWSLLFIIPGIIASYRYSMASFILAEHPGMTASEAITASKEMMRGNKFRLFCLGFSFIGWALLCALPSFMLLFWISLNAYRLGIPMAVLLVFLSFIPFWAGSVFFLTPYTEAAFAAFYRDVSRGSEQPPAEESAALPYEIIL